jgi:serine/threonine-protein kinase
MVGTIMGSYQIVRQIGEGGMGVVYLGTHTILGRPAAIKVLLPELSQRREVVGRFFNEARAATAIRHPGIVEIYDFGFLADGSAYIAMELLDGESLASRLRRHGRLSVAAAVQIIRQIAAALHAAHGQGITHRDLKPDNVFIVRDPEIGERVKLLDFGIAKLAGEAPGGTRTQTGMVMGTPVYMSPEQCLGASDLDGRSDLYSLGCIFYELVAGRTVFNVESAGDLIAHHLYFQPEPVRVHEPSVPEPLEQLIQSLLSKDPAMRPATADDIVAILDQGRASAIFPAVGAAMSSGFPALRAQSSSSFPGLGATDSFGFPALGAAQASAMVGLPGTYPGRFAPTVPTTLTGAAVAIAVPPRSKRVAWFAAAAGLAAAVAIAMFVAADPKPTSSAAGLVPAADPPPQPAPLMQPGMPSLPAAQPATPPPEAPAPTAPPAPDVQAVPPQPALPTEQAAAKPTLDEAHGDAAGTAAADLPSPKLAPAIKRTKQTRAAKHNHEVAAAVDPSSPAATPTETAPAPAAVAPPTPPPLPQVDPRPDPAPGAIQPGSLDAVSSIASISVDGPLPDSEIRSAVERALRTFRECYRGAARQASKTPALRVALAFVVDEGRAARNVRVTGDTLGLSACVKEAASKLRTRVAPDVGTATVNVVVRFQPTGR